VLLVQFLCKSKVRDVRPKENQVAFIIKADVVCNLPSAPAIRNKDDLEQCSSVNLLTVNELPKEGCMLSKMGLSLRINFL
jgi:hypothetical protein